jgi:hypothetical protein
MSRRTEIPINEFILPIEDTIVPMPGVDYIGCIEFPVKQIIHYPKSRVKALPGWSVLLIMLLASCLWSSFASAQTVTTGKSYINITRPNGGTFLPGDIIEVRATIAVSGGNNDNSSNRINSIRYNDTINLAKFTYIAGSLQMLSNEGRFQHQYSDAADTDSANINTTNGRLRFNIGRNSGASDVATHGEGTTNAGRLWGGLRPSFFGGTCIRMYVYRVQIRNTSTIVAIDSTIRLSAGNFRYRIGDAGSDTRSNFAPYYIKIAADFGLCSNSIGTNAIVGESGGTFGSGVAQNRAGGTTFVPSPYTFVNFAPDNPNDNYYGLANRTSTDGTTNANVPYSSGPGSASRLFSVWDIIGDHTGAVDPAAGNPPTNTGYAVVINASYQTNRAFTQEISGLCEETYYEFSAWFRNICRRCGCDSSGKGTGSTGYVPGPGNDSSGVRPNLTFQIDGEDFYTSGNIPYTGNWVKKGFVFRTKPGQTSFTITIRNNAPGGGGNDWALDDIALSTCLPNMKYSPSITPNVCTGNPFTIYDTVRSYFDNYTHFKWQRSINSGGTWTDVTAPSTPSIAPFWNGTAWQYVSSYTVHHSQTALSNAGDLYRLLVATSVLNLSNENCRSTDVSTIVTLNVLQCSPVLDTRITSFTGRVNEKHATLRWSTGGGHPLLFEIEKSTDGINFEKLGSLNSSSMSSIYSFTDPFELSGKAYYRISVTDEMNQVSYTSIVQLSQQVSAGMAFAKIINPFTQQLVFTISSDMRRQARIRLLDQFGRVVRNKTVDIVNGVSQLSFDNTNDLSSGIYILTVDTEETSLRKQVMKGKN